MGDTRDKTERLSNGRAAAAGQAEASQAEAQPTLLSTCTYMETCVRHTAAHELKIHGANRRSFVGRVGRMPDSLGKQKILGTLCQLNGLFSMDFLS